MSAVNAFENALMLLLFNNTTITDIGDAGGLVGSTGAGSTQLALATVAYDDTDTLLTADEIAYTGYVRPTQARSSAGWTVSNDTASNAALIQFGEMSGGAGGTAVHVGLGFLATGNTIRLHADLTGAGLSVTTGVNPQFIIGALDFVLD